CIFFMIHTINIATSIDEILHDFVVAINGRNLQRCVASIVCMIQILGTLEQSLLDIV
ncbi:hypothetical protein BD289DRAFT_334964, partial [Coniella lustricola]